MTYTFKGGVHVMEYKNTAKCPIEPMPAPKRLVIPLSQHIGAQAVPTVAKGDKVCRGQVIGIVENGLGCPVHSSVSGTVTEISEHSTPTGARIRDIVIENDFLDTPSTEMRGADKPLSSFTPEEIVERVRAAGISGMGGATFPTYAKIQSALGKVDRLIVNCAECEPFITANHRLMLERPEEIINGAKILLRAFGLRLAEIAVEDNKPDGADAVAAAAAGSELIRIRMVKTKYPQGDERQLIYAVTGRELPAGKLPADVGCVVFNAETCAAVFRAFADGTPLIDRIVTVDGDCVKTPKNLLVRIGTPISDLIAYCGGLTRAPEKIIMGGPMMGFAQWDPNAPITKGSSAILVFSPNMNGDKGLEDAACIRCGRCVAGCPMHLMPTLLASFSRAGDYDAAEQYSALSCVECGSCSYVCPAHVPIVQYIRLAKFKINVKRRAAAAAKK
ncbi:MAG: electron transport complex subunit RsxC [Eubacteriales bacterium]